jgi:hypothetical protein
MVVSCNKTISQYLLDLLCELTGRSKDKGLAVWDAKVEALENANGESGSLTCGYLSYE